MSDVTVAYEVARIVADFIPKGTVMNHDALKAASEFLEAVVKAEAMESASQNLIFSRAGDMPPDDGGGL